MLAAGKDSNPQARLSAPLLLAAIMLASFVTSLDNTVVNVALPSIKDSLQLSASGLEWIATSYLLTFAGLLLAGGKLADHLGAWRVLTGGLLLFMVASVGGGLAQSGGFLIAMRALQGVGGAVVLPATLTLIAVAVPATKRVLATGLWTGAIALALALGPLVGGALSQHLSWRAIFYINVPFVLATLAALFASHATVNQSPDKSIGIDVPGVICSALAITALAWAVTEGAVKGWGSSAIITAFALAVLLATLFVVVENRTPHPMIPAGLFNNRVFSGGALGQLLWGLGVNGVFFFTSLFLQDVLRFSPTQTGATFLPLALALILAVPLSAKLEQKIGAHHTVAIGLLLVALGLWMTAHVGIGARFVDLLAPLLLIGAGSALTTPITTAVLTAVPPEQAGIASGVMSTVREAGGVFGIVVTGVFVITRQNSELAGGADRSQAFTAGYELGISVGALLVLLASAVAWWALRPQQAPRRPPRARYSPRHGAR